jgi:ATP synthase protein I
LSDESRNDQLDQRIAAAKQAHERGISVAEGASEGRGWAIGIEFIGAVLVSGFIGWLIDNFAGTAPWAMIVLLVLGFAAGTRRALKTSSEFDADPTNDSHSHDTKKH